MRRSLPAVFLAAAVLLACSGSSSAPPRGRTLDNRAVAGVRADAHASAEPAVIVRAQSLPFRDDECAWVEASEWTPETRALARRARDALLAEIVGSISARTPRDTCAPDLVDHLRERPDMIIFLNGDFSEEVVATCGRRCRRVGSMEAYEGRVRQGEHAVAYLEIASEEPVVVLETGVRGVSLFCDSVSPSLQGRGGIVVERDWTSLYWMDTSGVDQ